MWLCTRYGFFSVVCARRSAGPRARIDPSRFMLRARSRKHLEALKAASPYLRDLPIVESSATDYPFRIFVMKGIFASVVAGLVDEIDYDNFKSEAHSLEDEKFDSFLMKTWSNGLELEDRSRRPTAEQTRNDHEAAIAGAFSRAAPKRRRKKPKADGKAGR